MAIQVIKRAERLPNGRVRGVAPPQLFPNIVRRLSVAEQVEMAGIQEQMNALVRKRRAFFVRLGLDPRRSFWINNRGEVIDVGEPTPRY